MMREVPWCLIVGDSGDGSGGGGDYVVEITRVEKQNGVGAIDLFIPTRLDHGSSWFCKIF